MYCTIRYKKLINIKVGKMSIWLLDTYTTFLCQNRLKHLQYIQSILDEKEERLYLIKIFDHTLMFPQNFVWQDFPLS